MLRIYLLLAALPAIASQTAPPRAPASSAPACFWASEITGFNSAGADRALVHIGTRATWELTLSPGCPDVDWAMRIGIRARGGERICPGRHAELVVPDAGGAGARTCLVRAIRKLSADEAAGARGAAPKP